MKNWIVIVIAIAVLLAFVVIINTPNLISTLQRSLTPNKFIGTWEYKILGITITLTFDQNTLSYQTTSALGSTSKVYDYTYDDTTIFLTDQQSGDKINYEYEFVGDNTLVVTISNNVVTFNRK